MIVDIYTKSINFNKLKNIRIWLALNHLFSKNQIKILKKMTNFEDLTKTENEYYSRIIKPRLNAIIDLNDFSLTLRDKI